MKLVINSIVVTGRGEHRIYSLILRQVCDRVRSQIWISMTKVEAAVSEQIVHQVLSQMASQIYRRTGEKP
jgi:hypothetical protein